MKKAAWASFWILGFIWGSSFLLIRIGVEDVPATQLVLVRTVIAAIGLNLVRMARGIPLPRDWPTVRALILIGIGNVTIPYTLISFAEQEISSGMAAVLQATASLFTLVIAHFFLSDERMSVQKIIGLTVGFGGVIVLSSQSISGGEIDTRMLLGQMGMVAASFFYAMFITYSRIVIKRDIAPIVIASANFIPAAIASAVLVVLEPLFGGRAFVPFTDLPSGALWAIFGLGFLNTFIAYMFFYFIVQQLGAVRGSMVTYVVPLVGLFLGWLVLQEELTPQMLIGAALIFTGIGTVNLRMPPRQKPLPVEATSAPTSGD
ncbi:MAG: DMT family transporter [Anaerolineae bacterium]